MAKTAVVILALLALASCASGGGAGGRATLLRRVRELGQVGRVDNGPGRPAGVSRGYLSGAGAEARGVLLGWMRGAGLDAAVDAAGNVVGVRRCGGARRAVLLGSHFDSVHNGGVWDGAYGVLAGLSALEALGPRACALPFDVALAAFDDEEGHNALGTTNAGAKGFVGRPRGAALARAAARALGGGTASVLPLRDVAAYVEAHIEQGPVLEAAGRPLGVVRAIAGQTRARLRFTGAAAHAGTAPMSMRRDALAAAARAVVAAEAAARGACCGAVATVGRLVVAGGGSNVVAEDVEISLDVRAAADPVRETLFREIVARAREGAEAGGVRVEVEVEHDVPAVAMDARLTEAAAAAVAGGNRTMGGGGRCVGVGALPRVALDTGEAVSAEEDVLRMTSGAGHDAQILAQEVPSTMLFVRCRGGVSHVPEEHVEEEDAWEGVLALGRLLERLAAQPGLVGVGG